MSSQDFKFEVGQQFRIKDAESANLISYYDDGDVFVVDLIDYAGSDVEAWDSHGHIYIEVEDVDEGWVELIEPVRPIKVGDVYEVIDDIGIDGPDGKMWNGDYPVGSNFTVEKLDADGTGRWLEDSYYLNLGWVGKKVKFLYNIWDSLEKESQIRADSVNAVPEPPVFESTVYDETYGTLEEALVNEVFYDCMESTFKTDRSDLFEMVMDTLTYEQRKEIVKYTLAIKEL